MPKDTVHIEIQDREKADKWVSIDTWEDYSITSDLWQPCDNFSLTPTPDLYPKFLAGNQKIRIYCNGHLQFTGITDEKAQEVGSVGRSVTITGRDMAAVLVDSTAPPQSLYNKTLSSLALDLIDPWTPNYVVSVVSDNAPDFYKLVGKKGRVAKRSVEYTENGVKKTKIVKGRTRGVQGGKQSPYYRGIDQDKLRDTRIDGSQKIWEVLEQHAQRVACALWMTCDANLFIGRPRYDEYVHEPSLVLKRDGTGNVRAASLTLSTAERFSHYKFLAQGRGRRADKSTSVINKKIEVIDPGEAFWKLNADGSTTNRFYRPTTIRVNKGCQDIKLLRRLARTKFERNALRTYNYEIEVDGHTAPNGLLWGPDCCVDVKDEVNGITGAHYVLGRTLSFNKDAGISTTLKLIPANVWLALDHDEISDEEYTDYMRFKVWW